MTDGWWALVDVAVAAVSIGGMAAVHLYNKREWRKLRHRLRQGRE